MQRYFASIVNDSEVKLSKEDEHHVLNVMRMRKGDRLEVVDNQILYLCSITSVSPLRIKVDKQIQSDAELKKDVTLLFCLSKGDKIDLVLQKATELGVNKVALIQSERTVVKYQNSDIDKKLLRFHKIMKEASEQSHRLQIPSLLGVFNIEQIDEKLLSEINYVAYEKNASLEHNIFNDFDQNKTITILIGPEGGFSEKEIESLKNKGFILTSLGKRILRAETAAIYALSVIGYLLEK